jgi:phage terminase large subunit-like protein
MNKFIKISTYIIILVIFTSLGFFVGKISNQNKLKEYEALKQNIDKFFPQPQKEVYSVGGTVKRVTNGQIILTINSFPKSNYPWNDLQEITQEERIVKISKDTKLTKTVINPFAEPDFTEDGLPKEPEEKTFNLSELKEGNYVQVSSIENIKTNKQITAKEIIFQEVKTPTEEELKARQLELFLESDIIDTQQ